MKHELDISIGYFKNLWNACQINGLDIASFTSQLILLKGC